MYRSRCAPTSSTMEMPVPRTYSVLRISASTVFAVMVPVVRRAKAALRPIPVLPMASAGMCWLEMTQVMIARLKAFIRAARTVFATAVALANPILILRFAERQFVLAVIPEMLQLARAVHVSSQRRMTASFTRAELQSV